MAIDDLDEEDSKMSFVRPRRKKFRVFHCSCWDDEQGACEVYIMVDDNGQISVECTNCNGTYELTEVVEKANAPA